MTIRTTQPTGAALVDPALQLQFAYIGNTNAIDGAVLPFANVAEGDEFAADMHLPDSAYFLSEAISGDWTLIFKYRQLDFENYPYIISLTNSGAYVSKHPAFENKAGWAGSDHFGVSIEKFELATISIRYFATSNTFTFFKNGQKFRTFTGSPAAGRWFLRNVSFEPNYIQSHLLAYSNLALTDEQLISITGNVWQVFLEDAAPDGVSGHMNTSLGAVVLSSAGMVGTPAASTGSIHTHLSDATLVASGYIGTPASITGTFNQTLGIVTLVAAGEMITTPIVGGIHASLNNDQCLAFGVMHTRSGAVRVGRRWNTIPSKRRAGFMPIPPFH